MKQNKKAVSALIATVLIIGITIAAFGIVYSFIMPVIREGIESSKKCSEMQLSIDTSKGFTYYDSTSNNDVSIMVSRGPKSGALSSVQLKVTDDTGNSATIKSSGLIRNPGVPGPNEDITYNVSGRTVGQPTGDHSLTGTPQTVSVAALIMLGNKEVACDLIPDIYISAKVA